MQNEGEGGKRVKETKVEGTAGDEGRGVSLFAVRIIGSESNRYVLE